MTMNFEITTIFIPKKLNINICFQLLRNRRLPFDSKNPIGFVIALSLEVGTFYYLFNLLGFCITLEIGAFMFMLAATEDIQQNLHSINEYTGSKRRHQQLSKQLINFIDYHSTMKQLSKFS